MFGMFSKGRGAATAVSVENQQAPQTLAEAIEQRDQIRAALDQESKGGPTIKGLTLQEALHTANECVARLQASERENARQTAAEARRQALEAYRPQVHRLRELLAEVGAISLDMLHAKGLDTVAGLPRALPAQTVAVLTGWIRQAEAFDSRWDVEISRTPGTFRPTDEPTVRVRALEAFTAPLCRWLEPGEVLNLPIAQANDFHDDGAAVFMDRGRDRIVRTEGGKTRVKILKAVSLPPVVTKVEAWAELDDVPTDVARSLVESGLAAQI